MQRKKWTPRVEVDEAALKFREKRKWQLALRRYVLEKNISAGYAFYFGLSIEQFRSWIELQFTPALNWDNFGSAWQFDHIVPLAYFDFSNEEDLILCWNFVNIRVARLEQNKPVPARIDLVAVKTYFNSLYSKTSYSLCLRMIEKIEKIESSAMLNEPAIEQFIMVNKTQIEMAATFNKEEFNRLNTGNSIDDIILEREILKRFG